MTRRMKIVLIVWALAVGAEAVAFAALPQIRRGLIPLPPTSAPDVSDIDISPRKNLSAETP